MHLSFLVMLALCGLTAARPPAGFNRPSKGDGTIGESNPQKQTSRDEILLRERRKAARQQVDQAHKRWLGPGLRPGGTRVRRATPLAAVSAVLKRGGREDCPVEGVESGWARFKGWELEWNDLPGQAFETSSEGACIGLCTAFGSEGSHFKPSTPRPRGITSDVFHRPADDCRREGLSSSSPSPLSRTGIVLFPFQHPYVLEPIHRLASFFAPSPFSAFPPACAFFTDSATHHKPIFLTSGCAGAQYLPEYAGANCYLKAPTINNGHFTSQTEEAKSVDAVLLLVGGCGVWTPMISPQMDQACCNT